MIMVIASGFPAEKAHHFQLIEAIPSKKEVQGSVVIQTDPTGV
jgi:hypothetical protein